MAVHSIIRMSELERARRMDAKYYHPRFLRLGEVHKRGQWLPIGKHLLMCQYGISIKMNTEGDGYPIFRMGDLKAGFAFIDDMKFAPISSLVFQKYRLAPGDVLFNRVNSEEFVGRTGIFKLDGEYVFASYLVRMRTNAGLSPDVLNLFLNCRYGILSVRRLSRRAVNQANVNAQELQSVLIPTFSSRFQTALTEMSEASWGLYYQSRQRYGEAEHLLLSEAGLVGWKPDHPAGYVRRSYEIVRAERFDAEHHQLRYDELRSHIRSYPHGFSGLNEIACSSDETVNPRDHPEEEIDYVEIASVNPVIGTIDEASRMKGREAPSRARIG